MDMYFNHLEIWAIHSICEDIFLDSVIVTTFLTIFLILTMQQFVQIIWLMNNN